VRGRGLPEAGALLRGLAVPTVQSTGSLQDPVRLCGRDERDVLVDQHERRTPITFERKAVMERDDRLLLVRRAGRWFPTTCAMRSSTSCARRPTRPRSSPSATSVGCSRRSPRHGCFGGAAEATAWPCCASCACRSPRSLQVGACVTYPSFRTAAEVFCGRSAARGTRSCRKSTTERAAPAARLAGACPATARAARWVGGAA
jgi:hypothetical protein